MPQVLYSSFDSSHSLRGFREHPSLLLPSPPLLSSPLSIQPPRRLCFFSLPPAPAPDPSWPTWGVSDDSWATPPRGPCRGRTWGPGGDSCRFQAPRRRQLRRIRGSCAAGRAQADALDAHARPLILCPTSAAQASGLRPAIRSRKSEPCQVSAWQCRLLSPPGVLSSVEATPSPWAQDTGKDFVRVQEKPESFQNLKSPTSSRLTPHDGKYKACRVAQTAL